MFHSSLIDDELNVTVINYLPKFLPSLIYYWVSVGLHLDPVHGEVTFSYTFLFRGVFWKLLKYSNFFAFNHEGYTKLVTIHKIYVIKEI